MLRELYELSHHFKKPPLGYSEIGVMWAIELSDKTPYLQKLTSKDKQGKDKDGEKLLVPDLRRNNDKALLIDDGAEYVFGIGERGERRHQLYLELLQQCIDATQDEGAKLVRDFIQNCDIEAIDSQVSAEIPPPNDKQGNPKERDRFWWYRDRIIFLLDSQAVTQRPKIQEFWAEYYSREQGTTPGTCLLTGEDRPTIRDKMPAMVKGVPNTQSSGAAIVSFDKAAYQAYGWDGNTNAPIGFVPAVAVHQTLDILLKDDSYHYRLGNQTFIFWGNREAEGIDPQFWDAPSEIAENLFKTPQKPSELPDTEESESFYLAVLKGNKGRIALSHWDERSTETLKESALQFVECQKLIEDGYALPVWRLRNAAFREPNKEHTDRIDLALVRSALFGEALPENFAIKVIDRICQEQDTMRSLDRAKALAFYCRTTMKSNSETPRSEVFAYYLGRIAFLMHWAQYTAQNLSREDTNVSRSLRLLSSTPAQVFPRLYEGCITNHLEDRQAQEKYGGILKNLKKRLNEEFTALGYNPSKTKLPTTFNTREQAQFFLGFGTARAEYFSKTSNAEDSE
ncbi:MAG: type I-C CRISPR-associated protein Cas8c/Csd1 [Spirulinaceae cyanobacterium]